MASTAAASTTRIALADRVEPGFKDEEWALIPEPDCVEVRGYGTPLYNNIGYYFKVDPPYVLREPDLAAEAPGQGPDRRFDLTQRRCAVHAGFARPQQVEVWAVEHQNPDHDWVPTPSVPDDGGTSARVARRR